MQRKNRTLLIWGDGAVGCGLAAAHSHFRRIVIIGPAGSGRGFRRVAARGFIENEVTVAKAEFGDDLTGDISLIAVKAYHLGGMARTVEASTRGLCVCLCNGMGLEKEWGPTWKDRVEPAVLTAGFLLRGPGLVNTFEGTVTVTRGSGAERVFAEGSIPLRETDDMEAVRWSKWVVNSIINPIGSLTGLRNDEILSAGLGGMVNTLKEELVQVIPETVRSRALHRAEDMLQGLLTESSNRCSMWQDLSAGRRTEIDFLTGLFEEKLTHWGVASVLTNLIRAGSSRTSG